MCRKCFFPCLVVACFAARIRTDAATTVFFNSSQVATLVASGVSSDTIRSNGYLFTYTRDKLFTGGGGVPIGRPVRVPWPEGVEAQAVTTPPPGVTDYSAKIILRRVDNGLFDLSALTARLLANTAATGAAIEIMPTLNGEDAFNDPLFFDASGYYGSTFSYDTSPNPLGSTALLVGFDGYKISLFVDFALTALTLEAPFNCDFNSDSLCDITDLNAMLAEGPVNPAVVTVPGLNQQFDLNGDGFIDNTDVDLWLSEAATVNGFGLPYLRSDANLDGGVDGQDFIQWNASKFTNSLAWDEGDFNGDGVVDGSDFILWNSHKFMSSDGAHAIPEPGTSILLVPLWILMHRCRKSACTLDSIASGTQRQRRRKVGVGSA